MTYVWFDALTNYMTAVGYGQEGDEAAADFAYRWPAQTHIVGKDIIRFHCVIWPAMLMALGEALPEHVFAHGFLTVKNEETGKAEKMSKSRGNAIAPREVIEKLGVEGYRYYFMTDVTPGTDGAISFGRMEQVYNADLANSWGNLISRSTNMCIKYFEGATPERDANAAGYAENPLATVADGLFERYAAKMEAFAYGDAVKEVMELVHAANLYIENSEPWTLAKDPAKAGELANVIWNLLECDPHHRAPAHAAYAEHQRRGAAPHRLRGRGRHGQHGGRLRVGPARRGPAGREGRGPVPALGVRAVCVEMCWAHAPHGARPDKDEKERRREAPFLWLGFEFLLPVRGVQAANQAKR